MFSGRKSTICLFPSLLQRAREKREAGGQAGRQASVCMRTRSILAFPAFVSPPLPLPHAPVYNSIFSEGGREGDSLSAPTACPGGDSRLVDCAKSSSLPPSLSPVSPIQSPQSPQSPHSPGVISPFHSLCVTNKEWNRDGRSLSGTTNANGDYRARGAAMAK